MVVAEPPLQAVLVLLEQPIEAVVVAQEELVVLVALELWLFVI